MCEPENAVHSIIIKTKVRYININQNSDTIR